MKLARKSVPFIIAVALLAACLLAVGLSPLVLPDYKGTIEEREQPQNFNLLYLNSGEELNLYPWNLYTGQEQELFEEEIVSFAANSVRILGGGSWTDEELYPLIKFRYSGQELRFLKDMALTEKDGRRYLVNMALDPNGLCSFSYVNQDEREATADEMDQALGKLQEDWEKFLSDPLPADSEVDLYEEKPSGSYQLDDGEWKTDNAFYMFFMRCQMLSDQMRKEQYSDYIGDNLYTIWELVLKSEFTSLSYDNHIYAMYSNDGGTSMVLIYSPIEERFVGFSLKY